MDMFALFAFHRNICTKEDLKRDTQNTICECESIEVAQFVCFIVLLDKHVTFYIVLVLLLRYFVLLPILRGFVYIAYFLTCAYQLRC